MSTPNKTDLGEDPDLLDLQSSFNEQQAKITALREIIRQTEVANDMKNASAQEKVKNIAQRLTHFKTKVTTSRLNRANSVNTSTHPTTSDQNPKHPGERTDNANASFQRGRSESSSIEKCSLLRQQIEQNRLKMAERESCKREIEEKVIEIKHKLQTTQQTLEKSTEISRARSYMDGLDTIPSIDAVARKYDPSRRFQATISQASVPEPTSSISKTFFDQGGDSLHNPANFSFVPNIQSKADEKLEGRVKELEETLLDKNGIIEDQLRLISQLVKNATIGELPWNYDIPTRRDVSLITELWRVQLVLLQKTHKISNQEAEERLLENYGFDPVQKLNETIDHVQAEKSLQASTAVVLAPANDDEIALRTALERVAFLEQTIATQNLELLKMNEQMAEIRHSLEEKTIELNVMTANVSVLQEKLKASGPKPLFPRSADEEVDTETFKLKQQLDESNKNMIKCKLRMKQLQKQVDVFKKMSDAHEEVARLTEELSALSVSDVAEGYRKTIQTAAEPANEEVALTPELQKRIEMLEQTCQNQATAMQLLEEQKNDLSQDLFRTRNELQSLNERAVVAEGDNGRIASQMLSIELEEQLEKCLADKMELTKVMHTWEAERSELQAKLKLALDENAELLSKIEKLSIEKVSSAESIEILENLTLHEKQEMEKSEKRALGQADEADGSKADRRESKENLNESLLKLMEESKELMDKVEMFTDERREVLEKLDAISIENQAYICELDKLKEVNQQLRSYSSELASAKSELEDRLRVINDEKETILHELNTVRVRKEVEGNDAVGSSSAAAPVPTEPDVASASHPTDRFVNEVYEQALAAVEIDLTSYNKNKDKQKKQQVSKKLATSAKNLVTLSRQLVDEYGACLLQRALLSDQIAALSQQLQGLQPATEKVVMKKVTNVVMCQPEISNDEVEVASEKSSDDEPELLKVELNSKNEEIITLKRILEAQAKAKATELMQLQQQLVEMQTEARALQQQLVEVQAESRTLQQRAADMDELHAECDTLRQERNTHEQMIEKLRAELKGCSQVVQQQLEMIASLEERVDELSRTAEEYRTCRTESDVIKRKLEELTDALKSKTADTELEKGQLEQKNQELLDKLKKFAANLKRKNVQCGELEQENKQLAAQNRRLVEQQASAAAAPVQEESQAEGDLQQQREENEALAQKLHHLKNELHRLLELKYQMEAECQAGRDEAAVLSGQLQITQKQLGVLEERAHALEQQLEAEQIELETARKEVASKNAKIEKCKAIIKEKIKETHRLQEHERRTSYLEDELRMTQSKLEDFHNQTLLLGRLKSEKEELNAVVKQEQEQRRCAEELLEQTKHELTATIQRERAVGGLLARVECWVREFGDRWAGANYDAHSPVALEPVPELFSWCTVLGDTERIFAQTLAQKTEALREVNEHVQNIEERARALQKELEDVRAQLNANRATHGEQDQTIANLSQQLHHTQSELQRVLNEHTKLLQHQSEWHEMHSRMQEGDAMCKTLQKALASLEEVNSALSEEIGQLRKQATASEEAVLVERANVAEQHATNGALREELELMRERAAAMERSQQELRAEWNDGREAYKAKLAQLRQAAEAEERKLTETLRHTDNELDAVREEYEQQLRMEMQTREQLNAALRGKDEELEKLCKQYEAQLTEEKQSKAQLDEALRWKEGELEVLRKEYEEQLTEEKQRKNQLKDALQWKEDELEALRKRYEEQLSEEKKRKDQLNNGCRRKEEELEVVRADYEHQLLAERQGKEQIQEALQCQTEALDALRKHFEEQQQEANCAREQLDEALRQKAAELDNLDRSRFGEADAMQQQLSETQAARADLELSLSELQVTCDEQRKELEQMRARIASLEKQTNEDKTNTSILTSLNGALNEELDQLHRQLDAAEDSFREVRAQCDALLNELAQVSQERDELIDGARAKEQRTEERCVELQRSLEETSVAAEGKLDASARSEPTSDLGMWEGWGDSVSLEEVISQRNATIDQLAAEKELMQQEITDLKVKSGKLLRKLKEFRAKQGAAAGLASVVEPKEALSELEAERARMQREKEGLLAKLDTLETACEKLTELKERQDRELMALRDASPENDLRERLQRVTAALQMRESEVQHLTARLERLAGAADEVDWLRMQLQGFQQASTINQAAPSTSSLELQLAELEHANRQLEEEKAEMGRELEALNQQILLDLQFEDRLNKALLELDAKNVEVQMLRSTLEQLQQGRNPLTATTPRQDIRMEAPILNIEQQEVAHMVAAVPVGEEAVPATVREVLERQEVEIVTLKEQLAVRSAEYARLAAHVDPNRLLSLIKEGYQSTPERSQLPSTLQQQAGDDRVARSELELALYLIYQRDMRCDELELELRNLLEERDALQLRLSNALRMHEEFRLKCVAPISSEGGDYGTSGECSIESSPEMPLASGSSSFGAAKGPDDTRPVSSMSIAADSPDLSSKISELHSISYSKEKRWQEEREDRNRQLTLIQRDLANMPIEAAAKIAGTDVAAADATPQQSASSVLLNWILGKK